MKFMNDAVARSRMTSDEFITWAIRQPQGRFELVNGEVIAIAPERARHNLLKAHAYRALDDAVRHAGLKCTVFTDGMTVVIDEHTAREPDALIMCSETIDLESLIADEPIIVVEVTSPSSERDDTTAKLAEYFSVPSIQHYLIVEVAKMVVIHHARAAEGSATTKILKDGEIRLDAPGLSVPVREFLPELDGSSGG